MKTAAFLVAVLLLTCPIIPLQYVTAQALQVVWAKAIPGLPSSSFASEVIQTNDGGYAVVGTAIPYYLDVLLVKTDSSGDLLWYRLFGDSNSAYGEAVRPTPDGGFIVIGGLTDSNGESTIWLIKTDSGGNMLWNETYGGSAEWLGGGGRGLDVELTSDGGFIFFTAFTNLTANNNEIEIFKTDGNGDVQWKEGYLTATGFGGSFNSGCIRPTSDGGYIISAEDAGIIHIDSQGRLLWSSSQSATCGIPTSDGGFAFTYSSQAGQGGRTVGVGYLFKTNSTGNLSWSTTLAGQDNSEVNSLVQAQDGSYVLAGSTASLEKAWLLVADSSGNLVDNLTMGVNGTNTFASIITTGDGGYLAAGSSDSYTPTGTVYLVKLTTSGVVPEFPGFALWLTLLTSVGMGTIISRRFQADGKG